MDVTIKAVEECDLTEIAKIQAAQKIGQSINRLLWKVWPNETLQQESVLGAVKHTLNDGAAQPLKAIDNKTGEIVGFIATVRKSAVPTPTNQAETPESQTIEVPERFHPDIFTAIIKVIGDMHQVPASYDHLDIVALVVRQDCYRQGVGSKLMKAAFDRAQAENLPLFAQSEPSSHAFFKKLGFKEAKVADFDLALFAEPLSGYGILRLAAVLWYP